MQIPPNEFLYVNKNPLLPPKDEAMALLQFIIMKVNNSSEKNLKICLGDYSVRDHFFVMILKELKFSLENKHIQRELTHCDKIEICGKYPEEGSVVIWGADSN